MEAALYLAAGGRQALIIEKTPHLGGVASKIKELDSRVEELKSNISQTPTVEVYCSTIPTRIRGVKDSFSVQLLRDEEQLEEAFENIIFAAGSPLQFPEKYNEIAESIHTMTLLDLENGFTSSNSIPGQGLITFILGYNDNPYSFSMRNALRSAHYLKTEHHRDVLIIADEIRFDDPWIPDLYRSCRDLGIQFIKSELPPSFNSDGDHLRLRVQDSALSLDGQDVYVEANISLAVFEPMYQPKTFTSLFWSPHDPDKDSDGFYGIENLHLHPIHSGRAGIYFVGSLTGPKDVHKCREEAAIVAGHIMAPADEHPHAVIDEFKCASCLTCVRLCPHHAIMMDRVAVATEAACYGCGIRLRSSDASLTLVP